jgi:hydroxymethylpyrimidine/phosphomethylpyrimidine kinase
MNEQKNRSRHAGLRVMCVTDLESSGETGVLLSGRVAMAMGCRAEAVVTAVTWWTRSAVRVHKVPPAVVASTLDSLCSNEIGACVVGALPSAQTASRVLARLRRRGVTRRVLRPTVFNRAGDRILSSAGVARLRSFLPDMACIIADLPDALAVCGSGMAAGFQGNLGAAAAAGLVARGASTALVRDVEREESYLCQPACCKELSGASQARGAGWALATATACYLSSGEQADRACELAHAWISSAEW